MPTEPASKRTIVFFDGQNLFYAAWEAFGYPYPNYDPVALATAVCRPRGWTVREIRFYTGVHAAARDRFWHGFWTNKLAVMGARGVKTIPRPLRYRNRTDWIRIDRSLYDSCIDPRDYRPPRCGAGGAP